MEASKRRPFARFIYALGIRQVGEHVSGLLAERFGSIEDLMRADVDTLIAIPEIGPEAANSITAFFGDPKNRDDHRAHPVGRSWSSNMNNTAEKARRPHIRLHRLLTSMSRDQARITVEDLGAKTASSVSKKVELRSRRRRSRLETGQSPGTRELRSSPSKNFWN